MVNAGDIVKWVDSPHSLYYDKHTHYYKVKAVVGDYLLLVGFEPNTWPQSNFEELTPAEQMEITLLGGVIYDYE